MALEFTRLDPPPLYATRYGKEAEEQNVMWKGTQLDRIEMASKEKLVQVQGRRTGEDGR